MVLTDEELVDEVEAELMTIAREHGADVLIEDPFLFKALMTVKRWREREAWTTEQCEDHGTFVGGVDINERMRAATLRNGGTVRYVPQPQDDVIDVEPIVVGEPTKRKRKPKNVYFRSAEV